MSSLIETSSNPFANEHACLRLVKELLQLNEINKLDKILLTPDSILVRCKVWLNLADPTSAIVLEVKISENPDTPYKELYRIPDWIEGIRRWQISIGMIARAAFIGSNDYTVSWRNPSIKLQLGYQGIRTSWVKRRFGMFQRSDGLAGPYASCSSWFSELLSNLLAWPGVVTRQHSLTGWVNVASPKELLNLIKMRLSALHNDYGVASKLPIYTHEIGQNIITKPKLTVVMIQTVYPTWNDLKDYTNLGRKRRRDHLAAMLSIAVTTLKARTTFKKEARAHLTLLPELSVHRDDLDLIERYVDKTKSILFCGLVFHPHPVHPDQIVNSARWVIPDVKDHGRSIRHFCQGKYHPTAWEKELGVVGYRPHQIILSIRNHSRDVSYKLTGCICYDATDINLAADLSNQTDFFIVSANNRDVSTFDGMAASLSYLMYQHYGIINTGEFGGTLIQAPYKENYERVLTHQHGGMQATISICDVDLSYGGKNKKTPPANRMSQ